MKKPVALVTCSKYPQLSDSDRLLSGALNRLGVDTVAVDWRDSSVRWDSFALVVVRSTWDYHLHPDEFGRWIDTVEQETEVVNPAPLLRWNSNKRYLADLRDRGIAHVPFLLVEPGAQAPHATLERWAGDIIVKPLVGASAWQIARTTPQNLEAVLTPELRQRGYLIQPYVREVEKGEYSLVFFDRRFSHAVQKTPDPGDFRSQREHGATHHVVTPDSSIVKQAAAVIAAAVIPPAYARIDGVVQDGRFVLMEAELIEPELFFDSYAPGAQAFANTLLKLIQKKRR